MGCSPGQKATAVQPKCADSFRNVLEDNHVPKRGRYKNSLVEDSANEKFYMYDACGAFVELAAGGGGSGPPAPVFSVNSKTGHVILHSDDISDVGRAHKFATAAEKSKLAGIEAGAQVNTVFSVNGKVGDVIVDETVFNVRDYGAVGDGAADDTSAIQDTIDAANSAGGGEVVVPAGTYILSAALDIYPGVSIRGTSRDSTVLYQDTDTEHGIQFTSTSTESIALTISNLTIAGPNSGATHGIHMTGQPLAYLVLRDIKVVEWGGTGVYLSGPIVSRLEGVNAVNNGEHGIHIDGSTSWVTSVTLNSCYGNNNPQVGIMIEQATYLTLNSCAADSNDVAGYHFLSCFGISANGCGAEGNEVSYIIEGDGVFGSNALAFNGCYSYAAVDIGFKVAGFATGVSLVSCHDNDPQSGSTYSLQIESNANVSEAMCTWENSNDIAGGHTILVDNSRASTLQDLAVEGSLTKSSSPPANASATGVAGQIEWDSGFIYVCTATNTWKRVAIATW